MNEERTKLITDKHKFHLKLFWEAIESKDYNKAIEYYNTNNFLSSIDKIMCEGILIGINILSDDVSNKMKSVERMNEFIL